MLRARGERYFPINNIVGKQLEYFFPFNIRQVISVQNDNDDVVIHACVARKGNKQGSKLKKLPFTFPPNYASLWVAALEKAAFGGTLF